MTNLDLIQLSTTTVRAAQHSWEEVRFVMKDATELEVGVFPSCFTRIILRIPSHLICRANSEFIYRWHDDVAADLIKVIETTGAQIPAGCRWIIDDTLEIPRVQY